MRLVLEQQVTLPEATRRLHVWQNAQELGGAKSAQPACDGGPSRRPVTELEAELSRLKPDLVEARMERDSLNNATVYVAKAQLSGTRSY